MSDTDKIRRLAERIAEDWAWVEVGGYCSTDHQTYCDHGPVKAPAPLDTDAYTLRLYYWARGRPWWNKTPHMEIGGALITGAPWGETITAWMTIEADDAEGASFSVFAAIYAAEFGEDEVT